MLTVLLNYCKGMFEQVYVERSTSYYLCLPRWNTSLPDSGPWFFRPMTVNADKSFNPDLLPR